MKRHLSISVRGALKWPDEDLSGLFEDMDTGDSLTADEAREYLQECLAEGKGKIPCGKCDNFDYKTGCKGHPSNHSNETIE